MAIISKIKKIKSKKPLEAGDYTLKIKKIKKIKSNYTGKYGYMIICKSVKEDGIEINFKILHV